MGHADFLIFFDRIDKIRADCRNVLLSALVDND